MEVEEKTEAVKEEGTSETTETKVNEAAGNTTTTTTESALSAEPESQSVSQEETTTTATTTATSGGQEAPVEAITERISKITPAEPLPWGPDPNEVILLFQELKQKQFLTFSWVCPGRRRPNEEETLEPEPEAAADDSKDAPAGADDFDFEEEATPTLRRPAKGQSVLKGSAKRKQPTSLAGILSNMERHRMMAMQDDPKPSS